jgi:hypothetical protein
MDARDWNRPTGDVVASALAVARLRAIRTALLQLHKSVLDAERFRFERARGRRIEGPAEALRLVLKDDAFAWVRPLSELIVQLDTRLAEDADVQGADVEEMVTQARALLQRDGGGPVFHDAYRRLLQDAPEVVVAHGRVTALLGSEQGQTGVKPGSDQGQTIV